MNLNRRGFISSIMSGLSAMGLLTAATPSVESMLKRPELTPPPAPPQDQLKFWKFLVERYRKGDEFYLHGDISGFLKEWRLETKREYMDITSLTDIHHQYAPCYQGIDMRMELQLQDAPPTTFHIQRLDSGKVHLLDKPILTKDLPPRTSLILLPPMWQSDEQTALYLPDARYIITRADHGLEI